MIHLEIQFIMAILNKVIINGRYTWLKLMMIKLKQNNLVSMPSWFMKELLINYQKDSAGDGILIKLDHQMETGIGQVMEFNNYDKHYIL